MRLAATGPCLGSQASSTVTISIFLPFTPPAALAISTAVLTPSLTMSPYCVSAPVVGITMPILMFCASAPVEKITVPARPRAAATVFMRKGVFTEKSFNNNNKTEKRACKRPALARSPPAAPASGRPWAMACQCRADSAPGMWAGIVEVERGARASPCTHAPQGKRQKSTLPDSPGSTKP